MQTSCVFKLEQCCNPNFMPVYFDVYHHFGILVIIFVYFSTFFHSPYLCVKHALYFLVYICFLHSVLHKINNFILNLLCYNCVQCIRLLSSLYGWRADNICGRADNILPHRKTSMTICCN